MMRHLLRRSCMHSTQKFLHPQIQSQFTELSSQTSTDFSLTLHQLQHNATGARVYYFDKNDPECAFGSIIRTFAKDNKGTPHILEHLACCGSRKYPIRDPFFNMLKRSVNTFMNAMTGDDFTCYPFSSHQKQDYNNLYDVYLDMSLRPILHELDFKQEGWRLQIGENGKREIKGIVWNQMKGAYQSAERQMGKTINEALFGQTPYRFDTGGIPNDIVKLKYKELKQLHQHYYHPSNMAFYYYGDFGYDRRAKLLQKLDKQLQGFQNKSHLYVSNTFSPSLPKDHYLTIKSATADTRSMSMVFYLCNAQNLTPNDSMCLKVLNYLLFDGSNALGYKEWIETNLAENIGQSGIYEGKLVTYSVSLKGINDGFQPKQLEDSFRKILMKLKQEGADPNRVQEFLRQLQINILIPRENNGIKLLQDLLTPMNHRLNFSNYLHPRSLIASAKQTLLSPALISQFLDRFFLNNKHFVVVRQDPQNPPQPDTDIGTGTETKPEPEPEPETAPLQQQKIQTVCDNLTDEQILVDQIKLSERQAEPQNQQLLPNLAVQKLQFPKSVDSKINLQNSALQGYYSINNYNHSLLYSDNNSKSNKNQEQPLQFYRWIFNFKSPSREMIQSHSLWTYALNKGISTISKSYSQLSTALSKYSANFQARAQIGKEDGELNIIIELSCLDKYSSQACKLVQEMIFSPKFEKQRCNNIFKSYTNEVLESFLNDPIQYCNDEAGSGLSRSAAIFNGYQLNRNGLSFARYGGIQRLYKISRQITNCQNISSIKHFDAYSNKPQSNLSQNLWFDKTLPYQPYKDVVHFKQTYHSKAVTHNYTVNFCSQQYVGPKYYSAEQAHIQLLLEILQQDYLHPRIREKGGAYGARASYRRNGNITLYSYMDPQSDKTFQTFDNSIQEILSLNTLQDSQLLQARLKQIGMHQRPVLPQNKGVEMLLRGYGPQQREEFGKILKTATAEQILATGRKYLRAQKSRCLFGKDVPKGFTQEKIEGLFSLIM